MQRVMELAQAVARVDSPVLIAGESGTGKERLARFVHQHSGRREGPFIAIPCAGISESLLESELFGHSPGAVSRWSAGRPGLLEAACGGTIYLGDVDAIPLPLQLKLLCATQDQEVRRVGENRRRRIDVRIMAATHQELLSETATRRFRKDLCNRLKGTPLALPPLRDRPEDILPLARLLLEEASVWMKRPVDEFPEPVAGQLLSYPWPGNVRELADVMERAVAITMANRVYVENLPPEARAELDAFTVV